MRYTKSSGQTGVGPADWFTGTVYIDGIRNPDEQSAVGCAHVRFTPGARTAWHTHPKGQTLYVTDEELKEALLHLAFYSGWPNGMGATTVLKNIIDNEEQA